MTRSTLRFLALWLGLGLLPLSLAARHIIGGVITYECLGEVSPGVNRYKFKMIMYRDCNGGGAPYDNPANMAIYKGSYQDNFQYETFEVFIQDIQNLTATPPDCVANIPNLCVEEGVYEFERDLPVDDVDSYFIVYQRCCRNNTINNIIDPGGVGATYYAELTPAGQKVCNNSPVFNNFPPILICNNFPIDFDHSASDVDGDLLLYSFFAPLAGGGPILTSPGVTGCNGAIPIPPCAPPFDQVVFTQPTYDFDEPMGGSPKVTLNGITGLITGSPNTLGQFVVGVQVEEYRNGVLLSVLRREFQFNVTDCTPEVFAAIKSDSIAGPKRYVLQSCGDFDVTFINESKGSTPSSIKNYAWTFDLKNGTTATDTARNATIKFPAIGTYTGKMVLNPGSKCSDSAYITVNIFPEIKADFSYDYDTCVAGPVVFTDLSTGLGGINKWDWNFGVPGGISDQRNPTYKYGIPGDHPVRLRVTDQNKCSDVAVKPIKYFPAPPLIIISPDKFLGCAPAEITFTNLSSPIDDTYKIVWTFGDGGTTEGVISPTHLYDKVGLYDVTVAITSPIGCFIADTFPRLIRAEPSPTANFTCDPDSLLTNFNSTVAFTDLSLLANRWNWTFDKYGYSTQQNPTFTFPDTGLVKIRLIVTHPAGCKDSMSKVLDIRPEIRWYMPNAFTPNADSNNDGFLGKGFLLGVDDFNMMIWNRWGELVFETSDPELAWNGRVRNSGEMSPAGVYVVVVRFTGPRGSPYEYKGFATLVR
jgi:gliding motility-associated-like protein